MFNFTPEQQRQLAQNARTIVEDPAADPIPAARLFDSLTGQSWILVSADPTQPHLAFGLKDLRSGPVELGIINLAEIHDGPRALGLGVEVDRFWTAQARLSDYQREAKNDGRLNKGLKNPDVVEALREQRELAKATFSMATQARGAFDELLSIGAPVYDHKGEDGTQFVLGAELRDDDDVYYADYHREVIQTRDGVRADVRNILESHGLRAAWLDAARCGIFLAN